MESLLNLSNSIGKIMIETNCYRDLTKKIKIKGLSTTSWLILITVAFIAWLIVMLWAVPIAIFVYGLLWLLEFFDEDIYQILQIKNKVKSNQFFA